MNLLHLVPYAKALHQGEPCIIIRQINLAEVLVRNAPHEQARCVPASELEPMLDSVVEAATSQLRLFTSDEGAYAEAQRRLHILRPILSGAERTAAAVAKIVTTSGTSASSIFRWLKLWDQEGTLQALMPRRQGKLGKTYLRPEVEEIIARTIEERYLAAPSVTKTRVIDEIHYRCGLAALPLPGKTCLHNRINKVPEARALKARSKDKVRRDQLIGRPGHYDKPQHPLDVVLIDHSPADIILVDEETREPLGSRRPIISVAIDARTRVLVGFYLSFDGPDALSVAMTAARAVCRKESYLKEVGVKGSWPIWGLPRALHLDNAKEFKSEALSRACRRYNIDLIYRPLGNPTYGGIVERVIKTLQKDLIHELPGTTKSNPIDRGDYDSVARASLTLRELESLIAKWIVNVYNVRIHETIQMPPLKKWHEDCFGAGVVEGLGAPPMLSSDDENRLVLDFLPGYSRTLDNRGIVIDHVWYWHDIFSSMLRTRERGRNGRVHFFRRDPRDISKLYYLDEEHDIYYTIPCRDLTRPPMSVYELRRSIAKVKARGAEGVDEKAIFSAHSEIRETAERAKETTRSVRSGSKRGRKEAEQPSGRRYRSTSDDDDIQILPFSGVEVRYGDE